MHLLFLYMSISSEVHQDLNILYSPMYVLVQYVFD